LIRLTVQSTETENEVIRTRRFPFVVGRNLGADLRSTAPGVWDHHFTLEHVEGRGVFLTPGSSGVTSINGSAVVETAYICNGANISAGALRIQFALADPEVRSFRFREFLLWGGVVILTGFQLWLIYFLPH